MTKNNKIEKFIDEINSKRPKKNHPTNRIIYKHIDEI